MAPNLDSCCYLVDGVSLIGCQMRTLLFVALGLSALASTMTADASMQAQVQSYAEMVCGTNLKTGNPEEPSAKKRCISGLTKLGKNAFKLAAPSIQKCKQESDFFLCIRGTLQIELRLNKPRGNMDVKSKRCLRLLITSTVRGSID